MSLPPFSGLDSACPKCGLKSPRVTYIERASLAVYGTVAYRHNDDTDFPCIQRTCGTCGFAALETPLTARDALLAPPHEQPTHPDATEGWNPRTTDDDAVGFA